MFGKIFGSLTDVVSAIGKVVDAVVPVGVGSRTKFAVIACPVLSFASPVLAAIPGAAPFVPLVPVIQHALCAAAPAFALAGLVRKP